MFRRTRTHVTYANAMASIAVFIALGGSAYAAVKIGSGQIVNNSVRSKDLRNNEIRGKDIRNSTVRGIDVASNTLQGGDILESQLGPVPLAISAGNADNAGNAGTLDGIDSAAFLQGGGRTGARRADVACCDVETTLLEVPGLGRVEGEVTNTGRVNAAFENTSGADIAFARIGTVVNGPPDPVPAGNFVADFGSGGQQGQGMNNDDEVLFVTFQVSAPGRTATIELSARNPDGTTAAAPFQVHYVLSTGQ